MSTKTSFKRIALVAVAALGFGMLSVAPSTAYQTLWGASFVTPSSTASLNVETKGLVAINWTDTAAGGINISGASVISTPSGSAITCSSLSFSKNTSTAYSNTNITLGDQNGAAGDSAAWWVGDRCAAAENPSTGGGPYTNSFQMKATAAGFAKGYLNVAFTPDKAGTYVIRAYAAPLATKDAFFTDWTVTVAAQDQPTAAASTIYSAPVGTGAGTAGITTDAVYAPSTLTGVAVETHTVTLANGAATALTAANSPAINASISGPGLIAWGSGTQGRSVNSTAGSLTANLNVYADGTAGVGTVTFSYTHPTTLAKVELGSKKITFFSTTPASLKSTQSLKIAPVSGAFGATSGQDGGLTSVALTYPMFVSLADANGNPVTGSTIGTAGVVSSSGVTASSWTGLSSNTSCLSSTITVVAQDGTGDLTSVGDYGIVVSPAALATSGCSATMTVSYTKADKTVISAAPVTFTVGKTTINSVTLTPDVTSYDPGSKVTWSLKALDSSGNPVADGSYSLFKASGTAFTGLTLSAPVTSTPFSSTTGMTSFVGGVKTATMYAPYAKGTIVASATLAGADLTTALAVVGTVSGTITVNDPNQAGIDVAQAASDAAAEATDAANAATDAANAAAEAADAATAAAQDAADAVAALSAQVTTMMNAMKAQLTSLTNLIIKIQKKVKA